MKQVNTYVAVAGTIACVAAGVAVGHEGHSCPVSGSGTVYVDPALIPPPSNAGFNTERIGPSPYATPVSDIGQVRTVCQYSHMAFDDPIVFPGQPGRSHLHMFFGNTGVNANSTATSIANTGAGTCLGGTINRSGYWVPAMIDTTNGRPILPGSDFFVYYKVGYWGVDSAQVKPFPAGLRMIAGDANATEPPGGLPNGQNPRFEFWCTDSSHANAYGNGKSIPTCRPGDRLNTFIAFPQCWDGVNLDSPDHKSHMAYAFGNFPGSPTAGCPASHPVPLVEISFNFHWNVPSTSDTSRWRLASDRASTSIPGGYSFHADWFNGWKPEIVEIFTRRCLNEFRDCGVGDLGDGRLLY